MVHQMKLLEKSFYNIKQGNKTIEFRLNDTKRRKIRIGDKIQFSKLPDLTEKITVEVIQLYSEENFEKLFLKLGYEKEELQKKLEGMYTIYKKEKEQEYGVLGIKMKLDTEQLTKQIEEYIPYNEQEQKDKETMLKYLNTFDNTLTRKNEFGHFTASSWIVNPQRTKVLVIYHNIYQSWGWTGGHCDGENDLLQVAIREAKEETSIEHIRPLKEGIYSLEIVCVDGHVKKGKYVSAHVHLNLTFLLEADEKDILKIKEDENSGVKWIDIQEAIQITNEENMKPIYQKLNEKLKFI